MQCMVAIHDTRLGPAIGGCRFLEDENERDALVDALRSGSFRREGDSASVPLRARAITTSLDQPDTSPLGDGMRTVPVFNPQRRSVSAHFKGGDV